MPRLARYLALFLLTALPLLGPAPLAQGQTIPDPNFTISPALATLSGPVAISFSQDETRLLIAEQGGSLFIANVDYSNPSNPTLSVPANPAVNLASKTCVNSNERGLLGATFDPAYPQAPYVYVFYTAEGSGANPCMTGRPITAAFPGNRVSRLTVGANGTIDPGSERILVDHMPSPNGNHNAGDVQFGKDGYLYITIGDGGCDYAGGGCAGSNDATRDNNVLTGKVLRIIANPDLSPEQRVPPTNPFAGTGTVCAIDGRGPVGTSISTHCKETFAFGLRNPFRLGFDPNTQAPTTRFFINDVGQDVWEEINLGEAGVDYRWNECEGFHRTASRTTLCDAPSGVERNPIHAYDHNDNTNSPDTAGCTSITDGVVVPNGVWPAGYEGDYLFADYVCGRVFRIDPSGAQPLARSLFGSSLGSIADMTFGPGPDGKRALYLVNIGSGTIRRIFPTGGGNRAPLAELTADPQSGSRTVTFDGSGSTDLDAGDTLTYLWNFGDGVTDSTSANTIQHEYATGGQFTASLQVRDQSQALSNIATIVIDTENSPPSVTMISPTNGATFAVGDTITLQATATDLQDGPLADSQLSWEVLRHHRAGQVGAHTHPFFGPQSGNNLTFTAPSPEDLDGATNSHLEVRLTATDSGGATTTVTRTIEPEKVALTIATTPAGMRVTVEGVELSDGQTFTGWRNDQIDLAALPQQAPNGQWLALLTWENNATTTIRTITVPAAPQTYRATFGRPADLIFMPLIAQQ